MTSIVGAFPTTLQNGTLEDATQVMSLFSYIQSQVNGNACPATTVSVILKGDGSGGTTAAIPGTDYQTPMPAGSMIDYGGSAAPSGWLLCDGSAVSRATYAALFTAIGVVWGPGDGATTFNVPDLRRRTTIGVGGAAVAGPANTLGAVGGEETHVLTTGELATHNHTATSSDAGHVHGINQAAHTHGLLPGGQIARFLNLSVAGGANYAAAAAVSTNDVTDTQPGSAILSIQTGTALVTTTVNNNGSNTAHNTMQPSAVVTKIIKT